MLTAQSVLPEVPTANLKITQFHKIILLLLLYYYSIIQYYCTTYSPFLLPAPLPLKNSHLQIRKESLYSAQLKTASNPHRIYRVLLARLR
jgi:hypothetical protein